MNIIKLIQLKPYFIGNYRIELHQKKPIDNFHLEQYFRIIYFFGAMERVTEF